MSVHGAAKAELLDWHVSVEPRTSLQSPPRPVSPLSGVCGGDPSYAARVPNTALTLRPLSHCDQSPASSGGSPAFQLRPPPPTRSAAILSTPTWTMPSWSPASPNSHPQARPPLTVAVTQGTALLQRAWRSHPLCVLPSSNGDPQSPTNA